MKKIITICLSTIVGMISNVHAQNYNAVSSLFDVETSVKPGMYDIQSARLKPSTGFAVGNLWVSETITGNYNVSVTVIDEAHVTKFGSTINYCTGSKESTTLIVAFNPYSNYTDVKCGKYNARINVNPEPNIFHASNRKAIVGVELYEPGANYPKYIVVGKGDIYVPVFDEKDRKAALEHATSVKELARNPSLTKGIYVSRQDIQAYYKFGSIHVRQDKDGKYFMSKAIDLHTSGKIIHNKEGNQSISIKVLRDVHDPKRNVDEETLCGVGINNADLSKTLKFDCGDASPYEGEITVRAQKNHSNKRVIGIELFKRSEEIPEFIVLSPIDFDRGDVNTGTSATSYMPYN